MLKALFCPCLASFNKENSQHFNLKIVFHSFSSLTQVVITDTTKLNVDECNMSILMTRLI